jgi:hypothetical protein
MLPSLWVASTKPEAALKRSKAGSLAKGEGGLWRRVIAGQRPACIAGRGAHYLTRMRWPICMAVGSIPGFSVISSSTVVLYLPAMEPSVSPLWTT